MTAIRQNDILFDDFSILTKIVDPKELTISSINTNCDCDGYYPNQNDEDTNSRFVSTSAVAAY